MSLSSFIKPGLNVILDGQWGSTGKGKLCGWIGKRHNLTYACSSFGPNAGHTYVDGDQKVVLKALPMAALTAKCPALIMPDSVIDVEQLMKETAIFNAAGCEVKVHPRVAIRETFDREAAQETGRHLAGTMQGTGHAISRKMLRLEGVRLAKDVLPASMIADTCRMVHDAVKDGGTVLLEMSQGFDLSLNHGHSYPYLTSRDITVGAALNSVGLPPSYLRGVVGSIRTMPIRVGNIEGGWSGPCHPDQHELTWGEVATQSGGPESLTETTTVTGRTRRVFTWSWEQLRNFCRVNNPDAFFLNFVQYIDWQNEGVLTYNELSPAVRDLVDNIYRELNVPVWLMGTGADDSEMIEL